MRLSLEDGRLPRLRAPGVPRWIGTDGERVGWALRDRLLLWDGDGVTMVTLPGWIEDVAAVDGTWTVALEDGFARVVGAEVVLAWLDEDGQTHPGRDVGVVLSPRENRLLRQADGKPLALPASALRASTLRPWASGLGACWLAGDAVMRMDGGVSSPGSAPGATALACGPGGAVVVSGSRGAWWAPPRGALVALDAGIDATSARFSADGHALLVARRGGAETLEVGSAAVHPGVPVGFLRGAALLLDGGSLVSEGRVLLDGLAGSAPSWAGSLLAGPGGGLWDLSTGTRLRADLAGGACATDGTRTTVHVSASIVTVLGGARFEHGLLVDGDRVESARIEGDAVVVRTLDGELGAWSLDGALLWRRRAPRREPAPSPPELDVPADGVSRGPASTWAWTSEGALFELPTPPAWRTGPESQG